MGRRNSDDASVRRGAIDGDPTDDDSPGCSVDAQHMFLFIGAEPNTQWLDRRISLDSKGFVVTGESSQLPLETSSHGVFAIGDVRAGSVKRVAAGVGEGAAAVAQIHAYLSSTAWK